MLEIVQLLYDRPKHLSMCLIFLILCGPVSFSYCDLSWAPMQNSNCENVTCRQVAKFAAFSGPFFAFSLFSLECCKICYSSNFCDMFSVSVVKNFLVNHFLAKTVKKRIIIIG